MKKIILLFGFIGCCFVAFSQTQICVDGSSGGSEDGTPSNPYHTIQAAVNVASNGDIIKVAQGTYSEAVQISQKKVQLLGGFAGSGDFNSANPQANETIIKGTSAAPCVLVSIEASEISGSLTISGFTIRNGERGIELSGGYSGFLNNITIENNIIENNGKQDVERGGGIGLEGNNVTIQNNVIRNNQAERGAAIGGTSSSLANFLIANNSIKDNTGYGDHAGGVLINGTGTITRNIFDGNVAAKSYDYGWGGGIVVVNYDTTKLITLSHNVWRNNYAPSRGGAVFIDEAAKVQMEHELFYNNTSKESGSAIYVDADYDYNTSVLYMNNCTVSNNTTNVSNGTALYVQSSIAHVENSIFWNNGSDFEVVTDEDPRASASLTVNYTLTKQNFAGIGNISADPLFADASNGDFHVKSKIGRFDPSTGQFVNDAANSPAIDAGNPSSDFSKEPMPNGGRVNLGCYGNTTEASKSEGVDIETITNDELRITVYPNPANEQLTINNEQLIINNVEIFDVMGRHVQSLRFNVSGSNPEPETLNVKHETVIDISHFPSGIYFIRIQTENGVVTQKIIKQ